MHHFGQARGTYIKEGRDVLVIHPLKASEDETEEHSALTSRVTSLLSHLLHPMQKGLIERGLLIAAAYSDRRDLNS